jgi:hypothetical protein
VPAEALLRMVTVAAARLLKLGDAGRLRVGGAADFVVIPAAGRSPAEALLHASRRDVQLIVVGGRPLVGMPQMRRVFSARNVRPVPLVIDDQERIAARSLGHAIARCPIDEPGVRRPAGV